MCVPFNLASGTDLSLEHEVELDRVREVVASFGSFDVEALDDGTKVVTNVIVNLSEHLFVLLDDGVFQLDSLGLDLFLFALGSSLLLLFCELLGLFVLATSHFVTLESGFQGGFDEVVSSEDVAGLEVLDHVVAEFIDMSRGLEDLVEGDAGALDLKHLFLDNKVLSPLCEDVGLERRARRSVVVESGYTIVDLKRRCVEEALGEERLEVGTLKGMRCSVDDGHARASDSFGGHGCFEQRTERTGQA